MHALSYIKLIRPQQWVKNLFVFLPMFFSGNFVCVELWADALAVFFCFSFVASAVYCLNDIRDIEADRQHPVKRERPVASGDVSVSSAYVVMTVLVAAAVGCSWWIFGSRGSVPVIIGGYFLLNVAYCLRLKHIAVVDVFIVASGFVLRVIAGGNACDIWVSPWLICMTFLLALFLAFAKRRDDVVIMEQSGVIARKNIVRYNSGFLDQTLGIIAAVTMMCYIIYTVSPEVVARLGNEYVYITAVFVLAGLLRYLQVTIVDRRSGSPTAILLNDRVIQVTIVGWLLTFIAIIYL